MMELNQMVKTYGPFKAVNNYLSTNQ